MAVRYWDGAIRYVLIMKLRYNVYTSGVFDGAVLVKNSGNDRCSSGWTFAISNHAAQLGMTSGWDRRGGMRATFFSCWRAGCASPVPEPAPAPTPAPPTPTSVCTCASLVEAAPRSTAGGVGSAVLLCNSARRVSTRPLRGEHTNMRGAVSRTLMMAAAKLLCSNALLAVAAAVGGGAGMPNRGIFSPSNMRNACEMVMSMPPSRASDTRRSLHGGPASSRCRLRLCATAAALTSVPSGIS